MAKKATVKPARNSQTKKRGRGPGKPFKPGQSGNPSGRPLGGRAKALLLIDKIMGEDANLQVLEAALREQFRLNPITFHETYIAPFESKRIDVDVNVSDRALLAQQVAEMASGLIQEEEPETPAEAAPKPPAE